MERWWLDLRYAVRVLAKKPGFTIVAVLALAIGIAANTAIFSLLYQVLLRPLPYTDASRLVFVWNTYPLMGLPQASVSIPDYIDRKTQAAAIEDATLFAGGSASLADGGQPEQVRSLMVTPSFFTTLQRQPFLGRGFTEDEAAAMIVNGFIEPVTKELPMEYAVELNRLIQLEMVGSIG